ncbi:class I SAM-dependent methyltransferase [Vibrio sp. WXL103]|uniref:class I SAM-dependent methyltransferase n=1 Tax=Vibrio sp. WXL103 TaxID=3450710 RepID=UPI003EC571F2
MDENAEIWRQYYEVALSRQHSKRTEFAVRLNESNLKVAVDCGCGVGSDIQYLERQGYKVYGFDINQDSIAICRERFCFNSSVELSKSSFESFHYPRAGIVIANSSLFFAEPHQFKATWNKLRSSIQIGGVFAGDFMGERDSWATNFRNPTTPLSELEVRSQFLGFEIIRFSERDEKSMTSLGKLKHWHTYSVVAVRQT